MMLVYMFYIGGLVCIDAFSGVWSEVDIVLAFRSRL
jgi:hypothetical protein